MQYISILNTFRAIHKHTRTFEFHLLDDGSNTVETLRKISTVK